MATPFFQLFRSKPTTHIQSTIKFCWLCLQNVLWALLLTLPKIAIISHLALLLEPAELSHYAPPMTFSTQQWKGLFKTSQNPSMASHFQGKSQEVLLACKAIYDLFCTPTTIPSAPSPTSLASSSTNHSSQGLQWSTYHSSNRTSMLQTIDTCTLIPSSSNALP